MRIFRFINLTFLSLLFVCCAFAQQNYPSTSDSFQSFWAEFRTTIVKGNKDKVVSLTNFPFKVRGPDDSDPVVYHDPKAFMKIYDDILDQQIYQMNGSKLTKTTMRKIIREKPNVTAGDLLSDDFARIEQFTFIKLRNKWLFDQAYFEE